MLLIIAEVILDCSVYRIPVQLRHIQLANYRTTL